MKKLIIKFFWLVVIFNFKNKVIAQNWNIPQASSTNAEFIGTLTGKVVIKSENSEGLTLLPDGKVGIGISNPSFLLSLGSTTAETKLAIYENGTSVFGIGVTANKFKFHLPNASLPNLNTFSFYNSPTGTELLKIHSDGRFIAKMTSDANYGSYFNFEGENKAPGILVQGITSVPGEAVQMYMGLGTPGPNAKDTACIGCWNNIAKTNDAVLGVWTSGVISDLIIGSTSSFSSTRFTSNNGSDIQRMEIRPDGKILLGNRLGQNELLFLPVKAKVHIDGLTLIGAVPTQEEKVNLDKECLNNNGDKIQLWVNGLIGTKGVRISLASWCDYVFAENYNLRPIAEVERFIKNHHHLPEVPSEIQILKDGILVEEMLKIEMKKIEELTLYIINQQKQIDQLSKEISELKK